MPISVGPVKGKSLSPQPFLLPNRFKKRRGCLANQFTFLQVSRSTSSMASKEWCSSTLPLFSTLTKCYNSFLVLEIDRIFFFHAVKIKIFKKILPLWITTNSANIHCSLLWKDCYSNLLAFTTRKGYLTEKLCFNSGNFEAIEKIPKNVVRTAFLVNPYSLTIHHLLWEKYFLTKLLNYFIIF